MDVSAQICEKAKKFGSVSDVLIRSMSGINELETASCGSWLTGHNGGRFLDFGSFALFLFGHGNERFRSAISSQLQSLSGSSRTMLNMVHGEALEALTRLTSPSLSKVVLLNTGAEAVEVSLKLASVGTGRRNFLHLRNSFHGKTLGALAVTDSRVFRSGLAVPEISRPLDPGKIQEAVAVIEKARPAAVMCEALQGEGGVREIGTAFLKAVREACHRSGSLLIMDEIQSGLGRTGKIWAFEESGICPDMVLTGKALGGGMIPVSAVIATHEAFSPLNKNPLLHSSTYGGNPVAASVVKCAVRCVLGGIPQMVLSAGEHLRGLLEKLTEEYSSVFSGWSGRGLMLGLHCRNRQAAGLFLHACFSENLLVTPCLTVPEVVRLSPPAVLSADEADEALLRMRRAAERVIDKVFRG